MLFTNEDREARLKEHHFSRMTEIQKQLENTIKSNYDRSITKLSKIVAPRIMMPGQLMTLDDIKNNILKLLDPTVTTLCSGDIATMDMSADIKSEYYDSLITPQISSITYAVLCVTSDYILGMMLYYMQKEFIFNYIMNDIVRPNIFECIERVRNTLNRKDAMDLEIKKSDELASLVNDAVYELMIKLDIDGFQDKLGKAIMFEFKDKANFMESTLNDSKYFVPSFLYNIVLNERASDIDIERANNFIKRYSVSHTEESVSELFKLHLKQTGNINELVSTTLIERNSYQGISNLQVIDGLTFVEIKIANRIINFTTAEEDKSFIDKSEVLKNIQSVVKKYHKYDSVVKLSGNDVVITTSDGVTKSYNIRKEGLSDILNDPFSVFKQSQFIKHIFTTNKVKSALYQTGITKDEDDLTTMSLSRQTLNNRTPEEKVQHRNQQIQRLYNELKRDTRTMDEYTRLTTNKIEEIKYMNPTQSKTYVINDKARLLLTLVETEYLYRQILQEIVAQPKQLL